MINPIGLGAGGFFGKEGVVRGVAPKFKERKREFGFNFTVCLNG
ncbi:hypothetical protein [Algoriphagus sp.]